MSSVLSAQALLALWDRGRSQTPGQRALELLQAGTGLDGAELASWNVGRRDRALMQMLVAWGGSRCAGRVACPACGELVQVDFDVAQWAFSAGPPTPSALSVDGVEVHWRLPTAGEAAALSPGISLDAARRELLHGCVCAASQGGVRLAPDDWPPGLVAAVLSALAELDPLADMEFCLVCPECGGKWLVGFDPTVFLWEHVDEAARNLLYEVHRLARAYGWSEAEILALSASRRAAYLEMCDT